MVDDGRLATLRDDAIKRFLTAGELQDLPGPAVGPHNEVANIDILDTPDATVEHKYSGSGCMAAGWHHDERIALVVLEIGVDRTDRRLLIGTEAQHDVTSFSARASLTQTAPSFMR